MATLDPGAPPSSTFDKGPPPALAKHFAAVPGYDPSVRSLFWYDWGPVFYRGRLSGNPKLLVIASDPGPTERLVGRTLVGDAGQRVQGLFTKLGLNTSYVAVNAFAYAVHPSKVSQALPLLQDPAQLAWRNKLLDMVTGPDLQAIIAFGGNAQAALALWDNSPDIPIFNVPHPSDHDTADLAAKWKAALPAMRTAITPDPGGTQSGPTYGAGIAEADYSPIPTADLPFGLPVWVGDDHCGRTASPKHNNSVDRSPGDSNHTLIWQAPHSA